MCEVLAIDKEYLERGALIDYLEKRMEKYPVFLGVVCPRIADFPKADVVEVKHGRWIMKETMIRSPYAKNAYCSECLEETAFNHNYCPNCGAKMDGA